MTIESVICWKARARIIGSLKRRIAVGSAVTRRLRRNGKGPTEKEGDIEGKEGRGGSHVGVKEDRKESNSVSLSGDSVRASSAAGLVEVFTRLTVCPQVGDGPPEQATRIQVPPLSPLVPPLPSSPTN